MHRFVVGFAYSADAVLLKGRTALSRATVQPCPVARSALHGLCGWQLRRSSPNDVGTTLKKAIRGHFRSACFC